MWYCNSLEFWGVTGYRIGTCNCSLFQSGRRLIWRCLHSAVAQCSDGQELRENTWNLCSGISGESYDTVPFTFSLSAFLRKVDLLIMGIMAFKAWSQWFVFFKNLWTAEFIIHWPFRKKHTPPSQFIFLTSVSAKPVQFLGGDNITCGRGDERRHWTLKNCSSDFL